MFRSLLILESTVLSAGDPQSANGTPVAHVRARVHVLDKTQWHLSPTRGRAVRGEYPQFQLQYSCRLLWPPRVLTGGACAKRGAWLGVRRRAMASPQRADANPAPTSTADIRLLLIPVIGSVARGHSTADLLNARLRGRHRVPCIAWDHSAGGDTLL